LFAKKKVRHTDKLSNASTNNKKAQLWLTKPARRDSIPNSPRRNP